MILDGYHGGWGQPSNVYITLTITTWIGWCLFRIPCMMLARRSGHGGDQLRVLPSVGGGWRLLPEKCKKQ